ncbi:DUF4080 domain-containing protein [Clostridium bovifaecis]|uniref:DUF4080 domain-containing protein n=1 Tax=Clostridium bovifaecis TaxID=2184719 RepID=A0A6I6EPQ1_9CLOT|nr:DUF4080 domain-containing protein [Clostridium bovifaecis]
MKKLKVLLVGINSQYVHSNLAIRYLKAYTKDLDYNSVIKEFSINDRVERILEELIREKADIIAFSCYIWNREMVRGLSKLIKLVDERIEIIYGGPEVSFDGREFLEKNEGEYLIEGEGEETFRSLIKYKIRGKGPYSVDDEDAFSDKCRLIVNNQTINKEEDIPLNIEGLFYKKGKEVFYGGIRSNIDINQVVFPYDEEDELDNKIVYYEASRGCPFRCKYCLSSVDRNIRFRDIEKVKKELGYLMDKKVRLVKFVDRTFNCDEKFATGIWEFLTNQDTETKFHFEISANILTNNQVNVLSKAPKGRFQFEVGVQTTNNQILKNINRYISFEDVAEKVKEVKALGNISQHLDLIAGLPGEDFHSFKNSFNQVYSIRPEEIQLGFLKILKGSPMMDEKDKWEMKYSPYPPYEILKTKDISYEELLVLKKVESVVDKYYNSGKFNTVLEYFEKQFDNPFDFYYSLGMFFDEKGYFSRNISNAEYYRVFLEFNSEKLRGENKALRNIIKYDYLMFNKKKWIPEFLENENDKRWTKELREKVLSLNLDIDKNKLHVEKFTIDMLNFVKTKEILDKITYLVYDENNLNKIVDVTGLI